MYSNNLRVSIISYWECPNARLGVLSSGGMNVYIFNLANQLDKRNIKVDIYTRSHPKHHSSIVYLSKNICLIHLPVGESDHYLGSRIFAQKIKDYIRENSLKYNLFHSHYYYSGLTGIILKEYFRVPLVCSFHTLGEMKKKYAGIVDSKRISAERNIVKVVDTIIASTDLEKAELITKYYGKENKIKVISPGVDHLKFAPISKSLSRKKLRFSQKFHYILFVGRIDPIKGIKTLLEAIAGLNSKFKDFKNKNRILIIGGDIKAENFWQHPETQKVQKFIKAKKLDSFTIFLGNVPHYSLNYYYSAADIVVMPSVYESFGLVLLEAMSSAATVLASSVGGLKYLVKNKQNGLLFENGNSLDLSEKLSILIGSEKMRSYLSKNAFNYSLKYNWSDHAGKVLNLYQKLVKI